ncbi:hypothetical protein SLE2022_006120 [Rubroshorea leprosula]
MLAPLFALIYGGLMDLVMVSFVMCHCVSYGISLSYCLLKCSPRKVAQQWYGLNGILHVIGSRELALMTIKLSSRINRKQTNCFHAS